MNWQPIETAPKDGRVVILGYRSDDDGIAFPGFYMCDPEQNHWGETGWFYLDENVLTGRTCEPTHWMELPEPPK
jgi:hypothetical protein